MLNKITPWIAIVALIAALVSFIPHQSSGTLGYNGAGTTLNSIQLTPSASYNGGTDLYALGWNTFANRFSSAAAEPVIDVNGGFIGATTVNGTTTLATTTLGSILTSTSSYYGTLTINLGTATYPNLSAGNACYIGLSGAPSVAFIATGFVKTTGTTTSTAEFTLLNGTSTAQTIASGSIVSAICVH